MEKILLSAACCDEKIVVPVVVKNTYQSDIQVEPLKAQLKLIPDLIVRHKEVAGVTIKKITNIRTLCDIIMNSNPAAKSLCPEIHTLLKLCMTVPVTSATAERTFSMRRITTYLHSTMTQERLNHSFMLINLELTICI